MQCIMTQTMNHTQNLHNTVLCSVSISLRTIVIIFKRLLKSAKEDFKDDSATLYIPRASSSEHWLKQVMQNRQAYTLNNK